MATSVCMGGWVGFPDLGWETPGDLGVELEEDRDFGGVWSIEGCGLSSLPMSVGPSLDHEWGIQREGAEAFPPVLFSWPAVVQWGRCLALWGNPHVTLWVSLTHHIASSTSRLFWIRKGEGLELLFTLAFQIKHYTHKSKRICNSLVTHYRSARLSLETTGSSGGGNMGCVTSTVSLHSFWAKPRISRNL